MRGGLLAICNIQVAAGIDDVGIDVVAQNHPHTSVELQRRTGLLACHLIFDWHVRAPLYACRPGGLSSPDAPVPPQWPMPPPPLGWRDTQTNPCSPCAR